MNADVNHHGIFLNVFSGNHLGLADGHKQDVGLGAHFLQIFGLAVADGDRGVGVFLGQHHGQGLAHDVAAAQHHAVLAFCLDARATHQFHGAHRGGGRIAVFAQQQVAHIGWMETVHVLGEAIYNTRCLDNYQAENLWFTTSKDGKYVYALCPGTRDAMLTWTGNIPAKGAKMQLLSGKGPVYYKVENGKVSVRLTYELSDSQRPFVLKFAVDAPAYQDLNKNGRCDVYENPSQSIDMRVEDLLQQMTLEEKVGQLAMTMGWSYYEREGQSFRLTDKFEQDMGQRLIGGSWAVMRADPWTQKTLDNGLNPPMALALSNAMQRWVREHTRLGIPLFLAEECPHGHMGIGTTVIPTALGRASTFNKQLENDLGKAVAKQTALQGANVAFGPVLDLSRDPRWSRMEEGYGEDPVLAAQMGGAYARGLAFGGTLPVMKHLSAYGVSEGGHNGASSHVGTRELLSQLSLPFRQGPEVGGVMTAYNDIDGVPCSANKWLIKNILRNAWQFDGVVISDLYAINGLVSGYRFQ